MLPLFGTGKARHFRSGMQINCGEYWPMRNGLSQRGRVRVTWPIFICVNKR